MKKFAGTFSTFAIVFAGLLSGAPDSVAAEGIAPPAGKELKALIATAKTPAEHRTIASYYRQQAEDYAKKSSEHLGMAEQFDTSAIGQSKPGIQGAIHCRYFASEYRHQAKKAKALAATHEGMAVTVEQR